MSTQGLSKEAFMALAAVGWADGNLDADEADAIVAAARDAGLDEKELQTMRETMASKVVLDDIDPARLTVHERLYIYAVARWIALVDGTVSEREEAMVNVLGYALRLSPKGCQAMDESVRELWDKPESNRPSRFDFAGLHRAIEQKLKTTASKG
jgi:uncharacterized membrane protein YebE (DUF533 family)